jgi:hypothetical protein
MWDCALQQPITIKPSASAIGAPGSMLGVEGSNIRSREAVCGELRRFHRPV